MAILTERNHPGCFMVSEARGTRSREAITVAAGEGLGAGTVLGRITSTGEYAALDPDATDGSQTAVAVLYAAVDASAAAAPGVAVARSAEVNAAELVWPEGITPAQQAAAVADLAAAGIITR